MKTIVSTLFAIMAILAFACCNSNGGTKSDSDNTDSIGSADSAKTLVLYYSQTGATETVAKEFARLLNADIEAIEAVNPYSGSYEETIQRCLSEQQADSLPEIKPLKADLANYSTIYLGYPVWFGTYARPVLSLLAQNDFAGKKIVPFCTFGSGGIEATTADLKKALPMAEILDGYGVRNARVAAAPAEVEYFLKAAGYIDGEVAPLPDFSAQTPVTDQEIAVFDAACGDYMFPLGTPVTAAKREIAAGTEYQFVTKSMSPTGEAAESTIFVVAPKADGEKPYFTKVVR